MPKTLNDHAVKVRGLEIFPPVALAPMVGLSHSALRSLVIELGGVGLLYTEMLSAKRLPHDNEFISPLLIKSNLEKPLIYQIITADHTKIKPALDRLHRLDANGIDLNLGCPAPMQRKLGAGSRLASNQEQLQLVLGELRRNTELPLFVKIRLGETEDIEKLKSFCSFLESEGVDMITIHARLIGEKFCRKPRWSMVGEVKDSVGVPIFVNGGIFTVEDAKRCLNQSGADGIMIGRGAVERPWICADIAEELYGFPKTQNSVSRPELFWRFVELLEERFAPERQLGRLKQFSYYFAASFLFGHHLGAAIQSSNSVDEAKIKASQFFNKAVASQIP